jgi:hypothetical protein
VSESGGDSAFAKSKQKTLSCKPVQESFDCRRHSCSCDLMPAETRAGSVRGVLFSAVRLEPRRGAFAKAVFLALAICMAFWPQRSGLASTPTNASVMTEPLARVVDWVVAHGLRKTVSAPVADALDFGTAEISVKQAGYQGDDKLAHLVAVPSDGSGNVILCHLSADGSGVCWRTDRSGVLKATARLGPSGHATRVSASLSERDDFETQKTYFIKKFAR